jgi:hypothetical protein
MLPAIIHDSLHKFICVVPKVRRCFISWHRTNTNQRSWLIRKGLKLVTGIGANTCIIPCYLITQNKFACRSRHQSDAADGYTLFRKEFSQRWWRLRAGGKLCNFLQAYKQEGSFLWGSHFLWASNVCVCVCVRVCVCAKVGGWFLPSFLPTQQKIM